MSQKKDLKGKKLSAAGGVFATVEEALRREVEGRGKGKGEREEGSEALAETEKKIANCPSQESNPVPSANAIDALPLKKSN